MDSPEVKITFPVKIVEAEKIKPPRLYAPFICAFESQLRQKFGVMLIGSHSHTLEYRRCAFGGSSG